MSVLDEAKDFVDHKFEAKRNVVSQEFRVLVSVNSSSENPETIRELLDKVSKSLGDYIYTDAKGSVQVVEVEPK
jgi:hypothetical protein